MIEPLENETYNEYIKRILDSRPNIKDKENYQEKHHIIPKCLGGNNDKENLIYLYPKEHYYAHKLLAIENPSHRGLQYAWWNMCHCWLDKRMYKVSAEEYAEAKERSSKFISEFMKERMNSDKNHFIGTHHSEETKRKIAEGNKGKIVSNETKEKMSKNHYDTNGANNPRARKVRCIETGEVFDTAKEAGEKYNLSPSNPGCTIRDCCRHRRGTSGKDEKTGQPLHWEWAD